MGGFGSPGGGRGRGGKGRGRGGGKGGRGRGGGKGKGRGKGGKGKGKGKGGAKGGAKVVVEPHRDLLAFASRCEAAANRARDRNTHVALTLASDALPRHLLRPGLRGIAPCCPAVMGPPPAR